MNQAKKTIQSACKQFNKQQQKDEVALTFEHDGKTIGIPKSIVDLVMNLNPKDDKKREAITKELFKKEEK